MKKASAGCYRPLPMMVPTLVLAACAGTHQPRTPDIGIGLGSFPGGPSSVAQSNPPASSNPPGAAAPGGGTTGKGGGVSGSGQTLDSERSAECLQDLKTLRAAFFREFQVERLYRRADGVINLMNTTELQKIQGWASAGSDAQSSARPTLDDAKEIDAAFEQVASESQLPIGRVSWDADTQVRLLLHEMKSDVANLPTLAATFWYVSPTSFGDSAPAGRAVSNVTAIWAPSPGNLGQNRFSFEVGVADSKSDAQNWKYSNYQSYGSLSQYLLEAEPKLPADCQALKLGASDRSDLDTLDGVISP